MPSMPLLQQLLVLSLSGLLSVRHLQKDVFASVLDDMLTISTGGKYDAPSHLTVNAEMIKATLIKLIHGRWVRSEVCNSCQNNCNLYPCRYVNVKLGHSQESLPSLP